MPSVVLMYNAVLEEKRRELQDNLATKEVLENMIGLRTLLAGQATPGIQKSYNACVEYINRLSADIRRMERDQGVA